MAWKKIFALMAAFLLFCCACGEKTPVSDPALQKQQQVLEQELIFCVFLNKESKTKLD